MKIALSGASGFIGSHLKRMLRSHGHELTIVLREGFFKGDADFSGDYIEGRDVVINLAGASISARWSAPYKKELYDSRILTTGKIARAVNSAASPPSLFINASAVGIYDSRQRHDEGSTGLSGGFLGNLIGDWEAEALRASGTCRVVILRQGLVLAKDEGALEKISSIFKMGVGARIGDGSQGMSWIHIDDLMAVYLFVIGTPEISGIVNAVGEYPTDNYHFSEMLGRMFGQPVYFSIPKFAVRWIFGEGSVVLTEGQKVLPRKLLESGFKFNHPSIDKALAGIYRAQG